MIQFTSISPFLEQVYSELRKGSLKSGGQLEIDTSKPNSLLDLFALGRLLAFVRELNLPPHNIQSVFHFPSASQSVKTRTQLESLTSLGFFDYCDKNGIEYHFDPRSQLSLPTMASEAQPAHSPVIEGKKYWKCLIPIGEYSFEKQPPGNERQVIKAVNGFVEDFSQQIELALNSAGIPSNSTGLELSRILFSILRELLSNSITHSTKTDFLFAMTISRDTWAGYRPHRPGTTLLSGQDKYELLVMDFGQGIAPSVTNILNETIGAENTDDYFKLTPWSPNYQIDRAKEESLLTNIFRGDLVIRKGRKSEGLYELGQSLSWFGGVLSLFTGRTELVISSAENEELNPELRRMKDRFLKNSYYLPGVIASPLLPSNQLKKVFVQSVAKKLEGKKTNSQAQRLCIIRRLDQLPSGFFGGMSDIKVRRRSELDAELIATAYQKARDEELSRSRHVNQRRDGDTGFQPFFWDINLKASDNIDIGYLDGLIQELSKRLDQFETSQSKNFFKLIFTNVPRNVINALRKRNCRSFLMLKGTFCMMLDEADEPHFIGVPRMSNNIVDAEDALALIFETGSVSRDDTVKQEYLGLSEAVVDFLIELTGANEDSVFFCEEKPSGPVFECYDVRSALNAIRLQSLRSLQHFQIKEVRDGELEAVFKLRNGRYVDSIYDFCLFWSDEDKLVDCAKLLLAHSGFPLVDTLVAFMNNGDRLAAAVQRFTKTPTLIIADPHLPGSWSTLEIDGDFVLVIDALYPGDDAAGYIKNFLETISTTNGRRVRKIFALLDFRSPKAEASRTRDSGNAPLCRTPVVSVPIPKQIEIPKPVLPNKTLSVVQNFQTYILSKPKIDSDNEKVSEEELLWRPHRYSPIELSTEFWQNISALGVIDSRRTGREDRNILFYENNERLVQNSRLRRVVTDFVADYLKNTVNLRVDVILHPTHPVGSFLAQLVSKQLNINPLVIPLTQRKYGGQIEVHSEDYDYYKEQIDTIKTKRGRDELNCIIVDDSVLTGSSLFTMMGVAAGLGLRTNGVLVLLSRLSAEISKVLSLLPINFAYLYHLHMPILTSEESPDTKLKQLNDQIILKSSSYFAQSWANALKTELSDDVPENSHFRPINEIVNESLPPTVEEQYVENIKGEHTETYIIRQIIQNLLLHPDPSVLNFYTRVAIAYDFLEKLVNESSFWLLMRGLFESKETRKATSQSIMLARKILYILAFSKHIFPFHSYKRFEQTCLIFIEECFKRNTWVELHGLVTDCIMWLGTIGSEKTAAIGKQILPPTLRYALTTSEGSNSKAPTFQDENTTFSSEHREAARNIIGSLAWAVWVYTSKKGPNLLDNNSALDLVESVVRPGLSTENNLLLIDLLEPLLDSSPDLRRRLGIDVWATENEFISELAAPITDNAMLNYLEGAPGYTCTLKSILRLCKADTVLLYVKNRSDKEFFLRVFETRQNKRADDDLKADHFRQGYLGKQITDRMDEALFFSYSDREHASRLDDFSVGSHHLWCMGAPVKIKGSEVNYYAIIGFSRRVATTSQQSTSYYYWLKCESLLRGVLPRIHSKYVESATAWNAHIQSIRPFHPIKAGTEGRSEIVNIRREILGLAMSKIDIGDLLRRAVRMSSEPVFRLESIRDQIVKVCKDLRLHTKSVLEDRRNIDLLNKSQLGGTDISIQGPFMDALTPKEKIMFCSFPIAVLEFIAYESLFNAIAYHQTEINVRIEFQTGRERFPTLVTDVDVIGIRLIVSNDIHPVAISDGKPPKPVGLAACETAASAVNGRFSSSYDEKKTLWVAAVDLPGYCVPDLLRRHLNELLS
jgi:adenine/guanine phosphoribosyltransferase-like PRPP-binding protein